MTVSLESGLACARDFFLPRLTTRTRANPPKRKMVLVRKFLYVDMTFDIFSIAETVCVSANELFVPYSYRDVVFLYSTYEYVTNADRSREMTLDV